RSSPDERAADLVAVEPRQVAIEDDDVVVGPPRAKERLLAVEREIDREAFTAKPDRHGRGKLLVILDDENAHAPAWACLTEVTARSPLSCPCRNRGGAIPVRRPAFPKEPRPCPLIHTPGSPASPLPCSGSPLSRSCSPAAAESRPHPASPTSGRRRRR